MFDKEFTLEFLSRTAERVDKWEIKKRELKIHHLPSKATSVIGPRRAGKTFLILNTYRHMKKNSIYLDLEHSAFQHTTHKDIFEIISLWEEYAGITVENVFLDEVQVMDEWERLVRSLLDTRFNVFLTGSSSKLLSGEIATQLRGRAISYLLLPLSFREFLDFRGFKRKSSYSISEKARIIRMLEEYVGWGGFPEIVLSSEEEKDRILKSYVDTIVYRDFVERFCLSHPHIAKMVFEFIFQNFSKEISVNKIANYASSLAGKNVKNIVYDYVSKLPETMSIFFVEKYEKSVYRQKTLGKKVYLCDVALSTIFRFDRDIGKRMENIVFLELLRETNDKPLLEIYYFKDHQQREVDFVVKEGVEAKKLIQVTYVSAKDEIEGRELRSLVKASEVLRCDNLLLITWDCEDELNFKGKKIRCIPLWKWLLFAQTKVS